ncbi:MAG: 2-amino-4-hydroxy-6-hydroxymethyldihydropteridine diphosphokinase [Gemmatimonadetes bacterium]|nr:2-amino-4-hydroxy-6-hydroxymethyldihydropteridine diphosphokinase [Gemmatimonadota bacterium]
MRTRVVLGLGSNVGDRLLHLRSGLAALSPWVQVDVVSSVYESRAVGYREQPDFLNLVALGETELSAVELLARIHDVEAAQGRMRSFANAPRTLDIDLLFCGDRTVRGEGLIVPHPAWAERSFVLAPLCEVAPSWTDPVSGITVVEHWRAQAAELEPVRLVAPPNAVWEGR